MSLRRDWPLTALAFALTEPGAYVDGALEVDLFGDPEAQEAFAAVLTAGTLPCGLPVRVRGGAAVAVTPAVTGARLAAVLAAVA